MNLRQYVIIPKEPRMSVGKIASQVAHATYMALENQRDSEPSNWWGVHSDYNTQSFKGLLAQAI